MTKSNVSKIGLLDNACHSLQRGYEMFNQGRDKKDTMALKEAIIWIHHGIELSIKQLLVQSNEYLIFDNVDEAVRKLVHLRKQPGMNDANVLNLFDSGGAYTVGFGKLVDRAAVMLDIQELVEGAELREHLNALTSYRNKIVHFTMDVKFDEIISILGELMEPFLTLLEKELENNDFVENCIPKIRENAKSIYEIYQTRYNEVELRIKELLNKFNGQKVSGDFFGIEEPIVLPKFNTISRGAVRVEDIGVDLIAKSDKENWLVEIKLFEPNHEVGEYLAKRFIHFDNTLKNTKLWLVAMTPGKVYWGYSGEKQMLLSSEPDIKELEGLLQS